MKFQARIIYAVLFSLLVVTTALAQQNAADLASSLRAQLSEVQSKEADLQTRRLELEEALKPENIQSSLAGVGSVHPEELREQRRRELEREKAGVVAQLDQLAISHRRLETAIAQADAAAYQQSANPTTPAAVPKGPNVSESEPVSKPRRNVRHRPRRVRPKKPQSN
jgi:oligoendopeptidase F